MAVLLADIGENHVGARADDGAVAAEARAQRHGPPKRGDVHSRGLHRQQDGDHRGDEGDVVEKARDDCRGEHQHEHGDERVASGRAHERVGDHVDGARFGHGPHDAEKTRENASVVHSTWESARSMEVPEISRMAPAASERDDGRFDAEDPWSMKPATTSATMTIEIFSRRRSRM